MKLPLPRSDPQKPLFLAALHLLALVLAFSGLFTPWARAGQSARTTPEATPDFSHYINPIMRSEDGLVKSNQFISVDAELVTESKQARPTRTPRPTATPPVIPPPSDPVMTNLMSLFAALVVVVILIGIWINRRRIR